VRCGCRTDRRTCSSSSLRGTSRRTQYERQQNAADPGKAGETNAHRHKHRLQHKFYFLDEKQQQQLVRDYLAHRWEKENYEFVRESCQQDNLRHLVDIRHDLRLLLAKVEDALKPRSADAAETIADQNV
jgi:hypothetical protein